MELDLEQIVVIGLTLIGAIAIVVARVRHSKAQAQAGPSREEG